MPNVNCPHCNTLLSLVEAVTTGGGSTTPPGDTNPPQPPQPPAPPGVRIIDIDWNASIGNVRIDTRQKGGFHDETLAFRFTTPNKTSPAKAQISGVESNATVSIFRTACLSDKPGELTTGVGKYSRSVGLGFHFVYCVGTAPDQYTTALEPNKTYYVNVKNEKNGVSTLPSAGVSADMFVELAKPSGL